MPSSLVEVENHGPTRLLLLNRPEVRNALNAELVSDLLQALDDAESEKNVRALVLSGQGKDFCAGADLKVLRAIADRTLEENLEDSRHLGSLFQRIHRSPLPVIAAVNGNALAGGCGLACVCDFVFAAEDSTFGFTESRIGFVAAIVSSFLQDRVGPGRTRDLLLTGRRFPASEGLTMGLVDRVVEPSQVKDSALSQARELAKCAGSSLALTKQLLADQRGQTLEEAMESACQLNARTRATDDCREGIAAFLEKRKPRWITDLT